MPKKKQVTLQTSIPGKFIPRSDPPPGSVFRTGANDNRLNARMAELLASSSTLNNEDQLVSVRSQGELTTTTANLESPSIDSPNMHSKLLNRRIVNMLETLGKPNDESSTLSLTTSSSSHTEYKSQPITFGQLRQGTISSSSTTIIEDKLTSQQILIETDEKHPKNLSSFVRQSSSDLTSITTAKSFTKHQTMKERVYYSPSFEQQNLVLQTRREEEQHVRQPSLTVDEILAKYYSKINLSTNTESHLSSSTSGFYIHSSGPRWNLPQNNQSNILPPPRLVLNAQNRPPPPSYSSSVTYAHPTTSAVPNPSISSSKLEQFSPAVSTSQHLLPENSPSSLIPTTTKPIDNNSARPPPPRYKSPTSNLQRSHSTSASLNDTPTSSQQSKPMTNNNSNSSAGFDREFSRLLYGKDTDRIRRLKHRRKAYSDPVKKSVEEARRTIEKKHRRVTSHLNKTDQVTEEDDETETEELNNRRQDLNSLSRRRSQRQSDLIARNREFAKKAIVPANPLLKRRIPSFLRVYSQASPSNDILLQWHLFNLSELESFYAMMSRLYKNENLARVQLYEIYRAALLSTLASKTSSNTDDDADAINTFINIRSVSFFSSVSDSMNFLDKLLHENSHVHIHDDKRVYVEEMLRSLINDGRHMLHVVADFDFTLTMYEKNGVMLPSTFGVIEGNDRIRLPDGSLLREKAKALNLKYHPIEIDVHMSINEKLPYMIEWWRAAQDLYILSNLNKSLIRELVYQSDMELKTGVREFITELLRSQTPILIFSAGVGDIIEYFLEKEIPEFKHNHQSSHIVSNFIQYDSNENLISFNEKLIHSFNKNEHEIHDTTYFQSILNRPNVILLGDTLGDIGMIAGMKNLKQILRIGYLNHSTPEKLEVYKNVYDIVICNDQTFDLPNEILKAISI